MRQPSKAVRETVMEIENYKFRFSDIAGQTGKRNKWLHYFESVNSVIYVISLIDFHTFTTTGQVIANSKQFCKKEFHVFLNKRDLLASCLQKENFSDYFPEFTGELHSLLLLSTGFR
ncbi:Guanine nucleotide-binding protein subunit alpha-13 [Cichlidogyrus casuarinus]|uniref:Guanine nucleotide-binding protein subunit alpha-13 n=1 Tax=Cichlidogyrus casuarinus TaxID=1844966 RepID=A0ABD2QIF5_9PLAT